MSALAIRRSTRRLRGHAAGLLLVLTISGAIAVHHIGMAADHHDGVSRAIEMCLGVFTAVGTAFVAVAIGLLALGRWPIPVAMAGAGAQIIAATRAPEARAGPPSRSQLCVWRR